MVISKLKNNAAAYLDFGQSAKKKGGRTCGEGEQIKVFVQVKPWP